jgi:hypothetical protein
MVVREVAAPVAAQAAPGGASIGHILYGRISEMRAGMANIAAHVKKGLALSSTDSNGRAIQAVMSYGHEVDMHVTYGSELRDKISQRLDRDREIYRTVLSFYPARNDREAQERQEAKQAITSFTYDMIDMFRSESVNAGIERVQEIEATIKAIESKLGDMSKIDESLTKSLESISLKPLKTDLHMIHRIQVKGKFDTDISFMKSMRTQISYMDKRKETVRKEKNDLYVKQDMFPSSAAVLGDIESKDKEMTRIERDIRRIQEDVMKYYQSGIHTSSTHAPSESVSLSIPNNPSHDKGVTLIKSTVAYVKTHSKDYPDIIPYIERIADDYNELTGIHYEPPTVGGPRSERIPPRNAFFNQTKVH